jgi:hypothetical protein
MKKIASLTLLLGAMHFTVPAISADECADAIRAASGLAQDYRNAVGKVRLACDRSSLECEQARDSAATALSLLNESYGGVVTACFFVADPSHGNDSIKVSAATVAAAVDLFPESVLVPCFTESFLGVGFEVGCPNGSIINVPRSNLSIQPGATPTVFNVSLNVGLAASTPIRVPFLGTTCTLTASAAPSGEPVTGTATFSSSTEGGPTNRLTLAVTSASANSVSFSGCGVISEYINVLGDFMLGVFRQQIIGTLSGTLCGAVGPELFGPCP